MYRSESLAPSGPRGKVGRFGILGGTFNPIHQGHLVAAEQSLSALNLDCVFFVPCGHPPHKPEQGLAPAEDRYLMTFLAIESNPRFWISRFEIDRRFPSYTLDTVNYFISVFGDECECNLIIGADAAAEIESWHRPEELLDRCRLAVVDRPGFNKEKLMDARLLRSKSDRWEVVEIKALDVSSTEIRRRVKSGERIGHLTPDAVEDYIFKHGLYLDD